MIAEGLAAEGAQRVSATRGVNAPDEAKRALEAMNADALAVPTDVGDNASVAALFE